MGMDDIQMRLKLWWYNLRTELGYRILPSDVRKLLIYTTRITTVSHLINSYVHGPIHIKDQAEKGLQDLGVEIIKPDDDMPF